MRISAHEASIKTASVEIKALTISGKQVTLAVFRQLEERRLIDDDDTGLPELSGIPWGFVNYHIDDCKSSSYHKHVVWQSGESLYRSTVYRTVGSRGTSWDVREAKEKHEKHKKELWVKLAAYGTTHILAWRDEPTGVLWVSSQNRDFDKEPLSKEEWAKIEEAVKEIQLPSCNCRTLMKELEEKDKAYVAKYKELVEYINQLDHLFIAV